MKPISAEYMHCIFYFGQGILFHILLFNKLLQIIYVNVMFVFWAVKNILSRNQKYEV